MARNGRSAEQLRAIAKDLQQAADTLSDMAKAMDEVKFPAVLLHGTVALNTQLPAVLSWVDKSAAELKTQLRAFNAGVPSAAVLIKEKSERQKSASARKKSATPTKSRAK